MEDKEFDDFLGIDTMDFAGKADMPADGNSIYQATYYRDLVTLFSEVSMEPEDTLVDFGCGLGRVLFYGNSRHYCKTTGIELDRDIYERLLENAKSYQHRFLDQEERMCFHNVAADKYEIGETDNFFYFFNPFSAEVFDRVLGNIIDSMKKCPRDIYLMLYYPTFEYQRIVRSSRYFVLKKIVKLSDYERDPDEKVYIYHMSRYFV